MTRPKKDQVRKVGKSLDSGQKDKSYLDFAGLSRIAYKRELVNRYLAANATPFMILEQAEIVKSLGYFRRHLPEVQLYYAVKANPHPHVLTTVKSHGAFVDVASHGEILKALEHGFTGAQMILANPYKNEAALKAMFELGISMFTFDSHRELQRIADFKKRHGYDFSPKCLLRFRPQVTKFSRASDGPEVQVNLASKFGAPVEEGLELLGLAKQLALQPSGIAYHIGSNCYRVPNYINNFKSAIALLREANARLNLNMSIVDLGGGFPNHTATAKGVEDLDEFYQRIAAGLRAEDLGGLKLIAEPGRTVAGPAGISVMSIVGRRMNEGRNWLMLDDGIFGSLNPIIHDHAKFIYFPADPRHYEAGAADRLTPFTLGGPTCDSFDTIAENVMLPEDIEVGERLFVVDNGAYSLAVATTFNGFQPAATLIDPGPGAIDGKKSA